MTDLSKRNAALLVGVSILLTSCAQLLFRLVMQQFSLTDLLSHDGAGWLTGIGRPLNLCLLIVGISLYGGSMIAWILALSRLSIGFAYPLLSLSYVIVYLAAVYLPALGEAPSIAKFAGSVLMVVGVFVTALDGVRRVPETDKRKEM